MKNRLEVLRKTHGIKREELADPLEVSRQTTSSLENVRHNPSILLAFKMARSALSFDRRWLRRFQSWRRHLDQPSSFKKRA